MKFNTSGLEFMKKKGKMSKDELFALGFIIGAKSTAQTILENDGASKEVAEDVVEQVFDNDHTIEVWNRASVELELETRTLPEIFPETFR